VWRGCEIFVDRRHAFLKTATQPLDFNAYERVSTLYRVAALIGWIRRMTLELRALSDAAASILAAVADTEDAALVDDASLAAARRLRATLGSV
jgi:hypothetical protein